MRARLQTFLRELFCRHAWHSESPKRLQVFYIRCGGEFVVVAGERSCPRCGRVEHDPGNLVSPNWRRGHPPAR